MTLFKKSAGLAAILAASVSGAALAQSANLGADAGTSVDTGDVGVSTDVTADSGTMNGASDMSDTAGNGNQMAASEKAGEMNYGSVISSLKTGANAEADISGITADSDVETMTLSDVQGEADDNAMALDNALANAEGELSSMHDMIAANADFNAMLEDQGYTADDVIGVYSKADGGYEVLIDDRS